MSKVEKFIWPSESFANILRIGRLCSAFVGANISVPTFRVNWITWIVITSISGYMFFTVITIIKMFEDNWKFMLEACCMSASVVPGTTKLVTGILKTKTYSNLCSLIEDLYKQYERKGPLYCEELRKCCVFLRKVIKVVGVIYVISVGAIIMLPMCILIVTGKKYLMMHFHLPGLDVNSTIGYWSTMFSHLICMLVGGFGLFSGDFFVLVLLMQTKFFIQMLKVKVKELNDLLEDPQQRDQSCMEKRLIDIIEWHQLYINYTTTINESSFYIVTVQVTTSGLSIILTIFIIMTGDWPGAYPYLLLAAINLYLYCILGTEIDICNEEFTEEIFNISWYNMKATHQKMVRLMLMQSQSPIVIEVAGFMPLTVATALKITKTIYSITMMMINFLGNDRNI